jgi:hypothetical protein
MCIFPFHFLIVWGNIQTNTDAGMRSNSKNKPTLMIHQSSLFQFINQEKLDFGGKETVVITWSKYHNDCAVSSVDIFWVQHAFISKNPCLSLMKPRGCHLRWHHLLGGPITSSRLGFWERGLMTKLHLVDLYPRSLSGTFVLRQSYKIYMEL